MEEKLKGGTFMAKREMKTNNVEETKVEQVNSVIEEETKVESVNSVAEEKKEGSISNGIVIDCSKLNIRKKPNKESEIVSIVDSGSNLKVIDPDKHKGEWYKVITQKGVNGFCMRKYVEIR